MKKTKKKNKHKAPQVNDLEVVKPKQENQHNAQQEGVTKRQDIINTTVKIVSGFSDMISIWKDKKVKRHKKRLFIGLGIAGGLIFIILIIVVTLLAAHAI